MKRFASSFGVVPFFVSSAVFAAEETEKKGMPQLDPSSYGSQLFWLAVFFCLFYLFLSLVAVPRLREILTTRHNRIEGDLNYATEASHQAEHLKQEWDQKLAEARDEGRGLIAAAMDKAKAEAVAREAALTADINQKLAAAEQSIATARSAALATINDIAAGIVAEALPKLAGITISSEEASQAVVRQKTGVKASKKAA
jgi:F-type H+-transporting ATPase subunit b